MKRFLTIATLGMCLSMIGASPALAGQKATYSTYISKNSDGSGFFMGQLANTRASYSDSDYVYCYTTAAAGWRHGGCYFGTASTWAGCYTSTPEVLNGLASMQGDSFVIVWFDAVGTCTKVTVYQGSVYSPKTP